MDCKQCAGFSAKVSVSEKHSRNVIKMQRAVRESLCIPVGATKSTNGSIHSTFNHYTPKPGHYSCCVSGEYGIPKPCVIPFLNSTWRPMGLSNYL